MCEAPQLTFVYCIFYRTESVRALSHRLLLEFQELSFLRNRGRIKVGVPLEISPILVAGNSRDFWTIPPSFEQHAGGLVSQIVQMQIDDFLVVASPFEIFTDRPGLVWKDPTICSVAWLSQDDVEGVTDKRNPFIVSLLFARVLSVAYQHQASCLVKVVPCDAEDFAASEGGLL